MKKILIIGTVAYDEIETTTGSSGKILGGAATYIGLGASLLNSKPSIISIVGGDFEHKNLKLLKLKRSLAKLARPKLPKLSPSNYYILHSKPSLTLGMVLC